MSDGTRSRSSATASHSLIGSHSLLSLGFSLVFCSCPLTSCLISKSLFFPCPLSSAPPVFYSSNVFYLCIIISLLLVYISCVPPSFCPFSQCLLFHQLIVLCFSWLLSFACQIIVHLPDRTDFLVLTLPQ